MFLICSYLFLPVDRKTARRFRFPGTGGESLLDIVDMNKESGLHRWRAARCRRVAVDCLRLTEAPCEQPARCFECSLGDMP